MTEPTPLPISMARTAGDLVFVSGQASVDDAGSIVPGTFEDEMRRSMVRVERVLDAHGLGLDDVVKVTAYVRDPDERDRYNEIYREYFSEPFPARTTLTNCLPPELHFEVDVVAMRWVDWSRPEAEQRFRPRTEDSDLSRP